MSDRSEHAFRVAAVLAAAVEAVDVPLLVVDANGEPLLVNAAWRDAHGVEEGMTSWAELLGTRRILAADGVSVVAEEDLPSRLALRGIAHRCELVLEVAGRRRRWLVSGTPLLDQAGVVFGAVVRAQDVTAEQQRTRVLSRHAGQLAAVAEACRAVLRDSDARGAVCRSARTVCDAVGASLWEPDRHGDLVATAADGPDLLGMRVPAGRGSNISRAFNTVRTLTAEHLGPGSGVNQAVIDTVTRMAGEEVEAGIWVPVVARGRCLAVLVVGLPERAVHEHRGQTGGLGVFVPVLEILASEAAIAIERQDLLARLELEAGTDPLTGVANRRTWNEELPRHLRDAVTVASAVSLVVLDLDLFKDYNDTHGHPAGDSLLREIATAWQRRLRPGDLLCRIGGEEFAVVLPGCDAAAARTVAEELRALVSRGQTASAGVAAWDGRETVETLVERADHALYEAKTSGRNQTRLAP